MRLTLKITSLLVLAACNGIPSPTNGGDSASKDTEGTESGTTSEKPKTVEEIPETKKAEFLLYSSARTVASTASANASRIDATLDAQAAAGQPLSLAGVVSSDWAKLKETVAGLAAGQAAAASLTGDDDPNAALLAKIDEVIAAQDAILGGKAPKNAQAFGELAEMLDDFITDVVMPTLTVLINEVGDIIKDVVPAEPEPADAVMTVLGNADCEWNLALPATGGPAGEPPVVALALDAAAADVIVSHGLDDCESFEKLRLCLHKSVKCTPPQTEKEWNCENAAEREPGSYFDNFCKNWESISSCKAGYVGCSGDKDWLNDAVPDVVADVPPAGAPLPDLPAAEEPPSTDLPDPAGGDDTGGEETPTSPTTDADPDAGSDAGSGSGDSTDTDPKVGAPLEP